MSIKLTVRMPRSLASANKTSVLAVAAEMSAPTLE
jgi:hypothetical protein